MNVGQALVEPLLDRAQTLADVLEQVRTDEPDSVHQLRVNGRRINITLWALGRATSKNIVAGLRDDVRWLTTIAARVRDLEVIAAQLEGEFAALATTERVRELLPLLEVLGDPRSLTLPPRLAKLTSELPAQQLERAARKPSRKALNSADARMRTSLDYLGESHPPDQALHAVRKSMRRARYVAELAAPVLDDKVADYAKGLAQIQSTLGSHQDASVTLAWLRSHRAELPPTEPVVERLIAIQSEARAAFKLEAVPARP